MLEKKTCHVLWDDHALTMTNPPASALKRLTLAVKSMEVVKSHPDDKWGQRKIVYKKEKAYTVLSEKPMLVIQTMQGFCQDLLLLLKEEGVPYQLFDSRREFAKPRMDLMHGFRFSQEAITRQALLGGKSGLVGAPTRWGKTTVLINIIRAYPKARIVVTLPGKDLVSQLHKEVKKAVPHREVRKIGGGRGSSKYQSETGITICGIDSLQKCEPALTDLLIGDEVHSLVTAIRLAKLNKFSECRRIGLGATLKGRFDGRDPLIGGYFGPVLAERTYAEAVAEGSICPITVFFVRVKVPVDEYYHDRDVAYNRLLFKNKSVASFVSRICHEILPEDWQTLIFISHEKQADLYLKSVGEVGTIAMAKKLKPKERDDLFARMQSGEVKRCIATNIYAQGVTFSDMRVMINCEGGGNNTSAIQKPGRLAEIRPGKKMGLVVDFMFDDDGWLEENKGKRPAWHNLVRDSLARKEAYEEKGYDVVVVENQAELASEMRKYL